MPNLTASIPHQLTRIEAKRRIQDQVGTLRGQHGSMFSELKETWAGDRLDFAATAMGQSVSGHLTIDDQAVHVEVVLPWFLSLLAGTMKQRIQQDVRHVLALPPPAPPLGKNDR